MQGTQPTDAAGSDLRTYRPLQLLLIALTFVTGILDAVTYLDFGNVFATNMTGNFVLLGLGVLRADDLSLPASLVAVGGFLVGVAAGGRLARWLEPWGQRWVVTSFSVGVGFLLLALLATAFRPVLGDYPALALLACAMGLINATASQIGIPGVTTTLVVTSTLTNLVVGMQLPHGDTRKRLRQVSAVAAIVLGAMVGAALLRFGAAVALGTGVGVALAGTGAYVLALQGSGSAPR
jgi:uncharacterized membrane protein YoaK (UPF0700 family)